MIHRLTQSPLLKLFLMAVLTSLIGVILARSFTIERKPEDAPHVHKLTDEKLQEFGVFSAKVRTGLYVRSFPKFDVVKNEFMMDAVVWFEFKPEEVSLDTIGKFAFVNGEIREKSDPDIRLSDDRTVFAKYEVNVALKNDFDFRHYPYGKHSFPITLTNNYASTSELLFFTSSDQFTFSSVLRRLSNWSLGEQDSQHGYRIVVFDARDEQKHIAYPKALFLFNFSGRGIKDTLIIFLPILFAMLLSLFSLLIPHDYGAPNSVPISLATAATTSLLAYRFVIQNLIPRVGYMTITDQVYTFALLVTLVPFFVQIMAAYLTVRTSVDSQQRGTIVVWNLNSASMLVFLVLSIVVVFVLSRLFLW